MGIQHTENAPASFGLAAGDRYLGNPAVVGQLVASFCADTEASLRALGAGKLAGEAFEDQQHVRIIELAEILGGRDSAYTAVAGWNGASMPGRLIASLGPFWRAKRAKWDDDVVAVLLEWLTVTLAAKWKEADGDDDLLAVSFGPHMKQVVRMLLGTDAPQGG